MNQYINRMTRYIQGCLPNSDILSSTSLALMLPLGQWHNIRRIQDSRLDWNFWLWEKRSKIHLFEESVIRVINALQNILLNDLTGKSLDYNTVQFLKVQHRRRLFFVPRRKLWVTSTLITAPTAQQQKRTHLILFEQAESTFQKALSAYYSSLIMTHRFKHKDCTSCPHFADQKGVSSFVVCVKSLKYPFIQATIS